MSKSSLVEAVANATELSKTASAVAVDAVFDTITKALKKEGKFGLVGFGTFSVRKRAARKGRNPATGEQIKIKASKSVGFKQGTELKKTIA